MIYDPERALWRPNRRHFLFGLAATGVAPFLPDVLPPPPPSWTVEMMMQKNGGAFQKYAAVFLKDGSDKPTRFLIDGRPSPLDDCPITLGRGHVVVGWGSDVPVVAPNVSLTYLPSEPVYIGEVMMFDDSLRG